MDVPTDDWTWDDFATAAKTVKEKTGKYGAYLQEGDTWVLQAILESGGASMLTRDGDTATADSYTHIRAHETKANLVCRLLLEKKK